MRAAEGALWERRARLLTVPGGDGLHLHSHGGGDGSGGWGRWAGGRRGGRRGPTADLAAAPRLCLGPGRLACARARPRTPRPACAPHTARTSPKPGPRGWGTGSPAAPRPPDAAVWSAVLLPPPFLSRAPGRRPPLSPSFRVWEMGVMAGGSARSRLGDFGQVHTSKCTLA